MFILCSDIDNTNFDETLLLSIFSKLKLTSLEVWSGHKDKDILKLLLQTPSIQETLEHFRIDKLDIFKCFSFIELLVKFKRIKTVKIGWSNSKCYSDDLLEELKLQIKQSEAKIKEKHSETKIKIYEYFNILYYEEKDY